MTLEPWPGGRWFRDLGDKDGHFWGHVQAIKRPTLLEISGPLFASSPLVSNLQYRLSETAEGTLISFRHTALGFMQDDHRLHVGEGGSARWSACSSRRRAVSHRRQLDREGDEGSSRDDISRAAVATRRRSRLPRHAPPHPGIAGRGLFRLFFRALKVSQVWNDNR